MCFLSKRANGIPDTRNGKDKDLPGRLEMYMRWLENAVKITPALRERSKVATGLYLVYADPRIYFEELMRERAKALY